MSLHKLPVRLLGLGGVFLGLVLGIPVASLKPSPERLYARSDLIATLSKFQPAAGRLRGFPHRSQDFPKSIAHSEELALSRIRRSVEVQLRAESPSRSGAKAAAAIIKLTDGKVDEAVKLLEAAVAAGALEKAGFLNDLAVAYLARSEISKRPRDITLALDAATMASEIDPALSEACFNRALTLEKLFLVAEAHKAWEYCAEHEKDPEWRSEIGRHLTKLRKSSRPFDLLEALRSSNAASLEIALSTNLQATREQALERLLPKWGAAFLAGRRIEAAQTANDGTIVGQILIRLDRDPLVAEVFGELLTEAGPPESHARLTALAFGAKFLQDANIQFSLYKIDSSRRLYDQAYASFVRAQSLLSVWALLGSIGCDFYRDDFDVVFHRLRALRPTIDAIQSPVLIARWHWIRGMTYSRRGDLRASLEDFQEMAAYFGKTSERENQGAALQLVGEMYRVLGDEDEAWTFRLRALSLLKQSVLSRRRLMLLRDSSEALITDGYGRAAMAFQNEAVDGAVGIGNARDLAEMLLWRARALAQLNRLDQAWADLQEARRQAWDVEDTALQERALADIKFAEADVISQRNPERALPLFDEAESSYQKKGHILPLATLLLRRARLEKKLHLQSREIKDLETGIELIERQTQAIGMEKDRVRFLDTSQELYDARIVSAVERGEYALALEFSERSRAFWTGAPGSLDVSWARSLAAVPKESGVCLKGSRAIHTANDVILEYALADSRLFVWLLRCDGFRFTAVPANEARVDELSRLFREAAQARPADPHRFADLGEIIYDLLIREFDRSIPVGAKLIIVPDKALYGIPFSALRDRTSGRLLLQDHEVEVAPSASFVKAVLARPSLVTDPADVLLVSPLDSNLPYSLKEIEDLGRLYPGSEVFTGLKANRRAVLDALDWHRVFHYAGHAEIFPADPFRSRLPMKSTETSSAITLEDLQGRTFQRLELVVLSACSSVSSSRTRSGGFLGLARPFLSGGVHSVIGTLWDIGDEVSRDVLVTFHEKLKAGSSASAALQAAQLQCFYKSCPPSAWAAFAELGDGSNEAIFSTKRRNR